MSDLIKIGLALLGTGAARDARRSIISFVRSTLLQMGAAVCALAAVGCAAGALWIYAAPILGGAGALLTIAGVFAVIALGAVGLAWNAGKTPPRRPSQGSGGEALLGEAANLLRQHTGSALIAALLAGVVVGAKR